MDLDFQAALDSLGPDFAARISRETRPPADYHLATILPEQPRTSYSAEAANMTVTPTMAGVTGMDSPYAPVGHVKLSTFLEQSAKITSDITLSEESLRELQAIARQINIDGGNANDRLAEEVLGFTGVGLQSHNDTAEWLRGQALFNGAISWTYGGREININYGIPAANMLPTRTGNAAYDKPGSVFWADMRKAMELVRFNAGQIVVRVDDLMAIMAQDANKIEQVSRNGNLFSIRRLVGDNDRPSTDSRDAVQIYAYGLEGSIIDPNNPKALINVPFVPKGKIGIFGRAARPAYRVGQGAQVPVTDSLALGYYHLAPTVEGGGRPGRWSRVDVPQERPWQLRWQGVGNEIPVIEAPDKIVHLSSEIGA